MPILYGKIDEIDEQGTREGTYWSAEGHRNYVRTFLVEVLHDIAEDNKYLGATQVCNAPTIPLPGAPYITPQEQDLAAVAVKISAKRVQPDSRYWWLVTVEYSTQMPEGGIQVGDLPDSPQDANSVANNPELRPWHIEWDSKIVMESPPSDLYGFPFWNSARQPFSPPPQIERARAVLLIVNNLRTFSRQDVTRYSYVCNSDTYFGCLPGTVLSHPPRATLAWYGNISYFRVRWMLEFGGTLPETATKTNYNFWLQGIDPPEPPVDPTTLEYMDSISLLNQGLCRLQSNPSAPNFGRPVPIYVQNHPISQPDLLGTDGQPVPPDSSGYRAPNYLKFRTRRRVPFTAIFTSGLGGLL